jgi:hypothetical protein
MILSRDFMAVTDIIETRMKANRTLFTLLPLLIAVGCGRGDPVPGSGSVAPQLASLQESSKGLVEGTIEVTRSKDARYGPSQVELGKVWEYGKGEKGVYDTQWLEEQYGKTPVVHVEIEGTRYSLLIACSGPWELWRLDGLVIEGVTSVSTSAKQLKLVSPGGDMASFCVLYFTDGLKISYWEEYHGP